MIATQLSLFDTPARLNTTGGRCWRCKQPTDDHHPLCPACLAQCPQKRVNGQTVYLTAAVAPANWQKIEPWCDDFRMVNGRRVRSAYPGYYRDEQGVVWEYDTMGRYRRW